MFLRAMITRGLREVFKGIEKEEPESFHLERRERNVRPVGGVM